MYYNLKLDIEPVTSLDQVLLFIRYYGYQGDIGFNLLEFSDGVEFKRMQNLDFFESLMQLHLEMAIDLDILGQKSNELGRKNSLLNKHLSDYKRKESGFMGKLSGNAEFYDIMLLRMNWDIIKKDIKGGDCLGYNVKIKGRQFLTLLFSKITEELGFLDQDREESAKSLYRTIYEKTDNKNNFDGKIELYYKFDDYLDTRRLFLPILSELQERGSIKIENIFIRGEYIHFSISRIVDISEKLFVDVSESITSTMKTGNIEKIEQIEYTKQGIKINGKKWAPIDSKKSEYFLLFVSLYFNENPDLNEVSVTDLNTFYEDNLDTILEHIDDANRLKYLTLSEDNIRNGYLDTISKYLSKEYEGDFLEMKRGLLIRKKYN